MSLTIDPAVESPPHRIHPLARPSGLILMLVAEVALLTFRFDGPKVLGLASWWAPLVSRPRYAIRMLVVTAAATAMFGGYRLGLRLFRAFQEDSWENRTWPRWFVAHGLSLMAFTGLTVVVCDAGAMSVPSGPMVAAWSAAGLATGLTWLAAVLDPAAWSRLARRCSSPVTKGAAVGLAAVVGGHLTGLCWGPLSWSTFQVVRRILGLVAHDVQYDQATYAIGASGFAVTIAPECSGFEGIGLIWAFFSAYLWWARKSLRWPASLLLLPLGTAMIWLANTARIASLILIGAWYSPSVALGGFHSQAGWLAFLAVGLGLVAVSRRSPLFAAEPREAGGAMVSNPTAAYLVPMLAIVATTMVTGAFSSGFDPLYGLKAILGGWALWHFRRDFTGLRSGWSWPAVAIGVAVFGLWVAMEPARSDSAKVLESGLSALPAAWAWAWVAARVIGSVAIVPLAEELAFRGYLIRRLISADFESVSPRQVDWSAILISSAAFGLLHGRWLAGMMAGLFFALALYRRGKVGDAVLAHATTNALIAATVLARGDLSMWS